MEYSDHFTYRQDELHAEDCSVADLAAKYGTPLYVYSRSSLEGAFREYDDNLRIPHRICYAVKANSSLAVLQLMASLGAGFDIVSVGELARVIQAGGDPGRVVYSGVGKREDEIRFALEQGIYCFNVESAPELERISQVASSMGATAPVAVRVNPNVDPKTHPYISTGLKKNKFGVPVEEAYGLYRRAGELPGIRVTGIDCHIGSQMTTTGPLMEALETLVTMAGRLKADHPHLDHLDIGGGLGINYRDENCVSAAAYMESLNSRLASLGLTVLVEPGRSMVGNAGILVTRVEYVKKGAETDFAVVDAGMNDMIRPALYEAWMAIAPVRRGAAPVRHCSVVGPICESGDFLGLDRELEVKAGDLLVQFSAGAYGFSMSSNYNSRPRAAEVMVYGDQEQLIRSRETLDDLWRHEILLSGVSAG